MTDPINPDYYKTANPAQAPDCHQGHKPAPKRRTTPKERT